MKLEIMGLLSRYTPYDRHNAEQYEVFREFVESHEILLGKRNPLGHITASAWIVDQDYKYVLLTHHVKLNRWLQLGGHTEEEETLIESALREANEESGLKSVSLLSKEIFDLDVHEIPQYGTTDKHYHFDLRFLMVASKEEVLSVSDESHDLKWIELSEVSQYADEESILRMIEKTRHL